MCLALHRPLCRRVSGVLYSSVFGRSMHNLVVHDGPCAGFYLVLKVW